jgi:hypothetical protein
MTAPVSFSEGKWLWLLNGGREETADAGIIGTPETTDPNLLRALAGRNISYYPTLAEARDANVRHSVIIDTTLVKESESGERLDRLFAKLDENGVAIIHLDTHDAPRSEALVIQRMIRRHPGYSFRSIHNKYIDTAADVHLLRCTRRAPYAYLFVDPPFYGKSNAAMALSESTGVPAICGDSLLAAIHAGKYKISRQFSDVIRTQDHSCVFNDPALTDEFLGLIPQVAGRQPFILDRTVPEDRWSHLVDAVRARGFRPVICSLANTLDHDLRDSARKSERLRYLEMREALLRDILNSRIWRWTAPLRLLGERAKAMLRKSRLRTS